MLLQCRSPGQGLPHGETVHTARLLKLQHASGQGTSLVHHHMIDPRQRLDGMPARHQQADTCEGIGRHGQRRRRRQRQRAGATHHQHHHKDLHRPGRITLSPERQRSHRHNQEHRSKPRRHPVRLLHQPWPLRRRALHQAPDARQPGRVPHTLCPQLQHTASIDTAAQHRIACLLRHRQALAGQPGLIHLTAAGADHTVHHNGFAGANQDPVTRLQLAGWHPLFHSPIVGQPAGKTRQHPHQRLHPARRALARQHFQITPAQQEENEHRYRVKVDLTVPAQRRPNTGHESHPKPQGHRHIHPQTPQAQIPPGALKEGCGRIQHHRQGQHQARPAQQARRLGAHVAFASDVLREGIHHHLHHPETRHEHPPQRGAPLTLGHQLAALGIKGMGAIADCRHRRQNP